MKPTIHTDKYDLYLADCLTVMAEMEAGSADAILTDLPYGTTQCSWDEIIPFAPMWECVKHVLRPHGVFVTTASQPFTSKLVMSNLDWFKYEWIWKKSHATGFLDARRRPMKQHENIVVFGNGSTNYYPVISKKPEYKIRRGKVTRAKTDGYGDFDVSAERLISDEESFPLSILDYASPYKGGESGEHPTQKPEALYRYLVTTYTNQGDTVLDCCMGSGTTIAAALQLGRRGIGIENTPTYFDIAAKRIERAAAQMVMNI